MKWQDGVEMNHKARRISLERRNVKINGGTVRRLHLLKNFGIVAPQLRHSVGTTLKLSRGNLYYGREPGRRATYS